MCSVCGKEKAICNMFVFMPGRDTNGIHNTQTVGDTCKECTDSIIRGDISIYMPEDRITFYNLNITE